MDLFLAGRSLSPAVSRSAQVAPTSASVGTSSLLGRRSRKTQKWRWAAGAGRCGVSTCAASATVSKLWGRMQTGRFDRKQAGFSLLNFFDYEESASLFQVKEEEESSISRKDRQALYRSISNKQRALSSTRNNGAPAIQPGARPQTSASARAGTSGPDLAQTMRANRAAHFIRTMNTIHETEGSGNIAAAQRPRLDPARQLDRQLNEAAEAGDVEKTELLFQQLQKHQRHFNRSPRMFYNTVIKACANAGVTERAEYWKERLREASLEMNTRLLDEAAIEGVKVSNVAMMMMLGLVVNSGEAHKIQKWQKEGNDRLLIQVNAICGDPDKAAELLEDVLAVGGRSDIMCFNKVSMAFAKQGRLEEATAWVERMPEASVEPDRQTFEMMLLYSHKIHQALHTYTCKIEDIVVDGAVAFARVWFSGIHSGGDVLGVAPTKRRVKWIGAARFVLAEGPEGPSTAQIGEIWVLGDLYSLQKQLQGEGGECATAWVERMPEASVEPDRQTFEALATAHAARGDVDRAAGCLEEMQLRRMSPLPANYVPVIEACAESRDGAQAERWLQEVRDANLPVNSVLYSSVLKAYQYDERGAVRVLEDMIQERVMPSVRTWNSVIRSFAQTAKSEEAEALMRRMQDSGVTPTGITYGILLEGCARSGAIEKALDLMQEMDKVRVGRSQVTYTTLMKVMHRTGHSGDVQQTFDAMVAAGLPPNEESMSIVIAAAVKAAGKASAGIKWFDKMKEFNLSPTTAHYAPCLIHLAKEKQIPALRQLLPMMVAQGVPLDEYLQSTLLQYIGPLLFELVPEHLLAFPDKRPQEVRERAAARKAPKRRAAPASPKAASRPKLTQAPRQPKPGDWLAAYGARHSGVTPLAGLAAPAAAGVVLLAVSGVRQLGHRRRLRFRTWRRAKARDKAPPPLTSDMEAQLRPKREWAPNRRKQPDARPWRFHARGGEWREALYLMENARIPLEAVDFEFVITACAKAKRWKIVLKLLADVEVLQLSLDSQGSSIAEYLDYSP
ncbi:putative pentatricopeptide repeat-containing protein, mitochondrial [Symbiodinium microadriaticum]|uniref:Putative pentatricopeptide repeat-containing protein, mitochondrial n=1 Tax=Symbiodinium microadriaticum TaxID=2951 RepID=A0A1Q9CDQ9_SYMMI|nr:putative pentatricopeptide repeat-containing protein, mitochondrial [Symbiodinium microadriaticum]